MGNTISPLVSGITAFLRDETIINAENRLLSRLSPCVLQTLSAIFN